MKVIDLLVKVANGEKVPKIFEMDIFGQKCKYEYIESRKNWYCREQFCWFTDNNLLSWLNSELKILDKTIEEDKEIEKLERINGSYLVDLRSDNSIEEQSEAITNLIIYLNNNVDKLNELIKAVNELKKGK